MPRQWLYSLVLGLLVLAGCSTQGPLQTQREAGAPASIPSGPEGVGPAAAPKRPRLGLALGGGAARGFAHIGVIQVLEEAGIRPDLVVGTSAGSVVAALFADGKNASQLQRLAETMEEATLTDWTVPFFSRGVMRGDALARYINAQVGSRQMENLRLPLGIVATDLHSGQGVLFQRGDVGTAVRASSSVPGVFEPVRINGREYVDGGLVSPVPVRFARQMGAEYVIAVDISSAPEHGKTGDIFSILMQTFTIMGQSIKALELREAELTVRPNLGAQGSADFSARLKAIEQGRQAMRAALPKLQQALGLHRD